MHDRFNISINIAMKHTEKNSALYGQTTERVHCLFFSQCIHHMCSSFHFIRFLVAAATQILFLVSIDFYRFGIDGV